MNNITLKHLVYASVVLIFAVATTSYAQNDDLDDIESDMESTLAESEAAQSAAVSAKKREQEERETLKRAKSDANNAMARAKSKEQDAAIQLKDLEAKIKANRVETAKHQKLKAAAEKKILVFEQKLAIKKSDHDASTASTQAARDEKEAQEKIIRNLQDEQRSLEQKIVRERDDTTRLTQEITELKKSAIIKEKELIRLRENSRRVTTNYEKTKAIRDSQKRKVSAIPSKIVFKQSKHDCDLIDAASDGALVIGKIEKGKKYELHRVVERRWVELQSGKLHGFAARSCF